MLIGLYDEDFAQKPFVRPFNLQLLKIATYYQQQKDMVKILPSFDNIDRYTKVYYRKDLLTGKENPNIALYRNVDVGGYYFTNGIYLPMEPEIENVIPNSSILEVAPFRGPKNESMKKRLCQAQNILLANNNNIIPPSCKFVVIHDYDIQKVPDWRGKFREIMYRPDSIIPRRYSFICPQNIYDIDTYKYLISFHPMHTQNYPIFLYRAPLIPGDIEPLLQVGKLIIRDQTRFYCGYDWQTKEQREESLLTLFQLIIKYKEQGRKFPAVLNDDIFDEDYRNFLQFVIKWGHIKSNKTCLEYMLASQLTKTSANSIKLILNRFPSVRQYINFEIKEGDKNDTARN